MSLNLGRERDRQAQLQQRSGKFWRPEEGVDEKGNGKNLIRVFKFKHKATKEDAAALLYAKDDIGKTFEEWVYPFQVQFGLHAQNPKIPVRATPETIKIYESLNGAADAESKAKAKLIRPQNKFAMNILDLNDPAKGIQVFLAGKTVREDIGKFVTDEEYGEVVLGCKGRDWRISFDKNKDPKEMYSTIIREKDKCRAINSKIEEGVKDLFDPKVNREFADMKGAEELKVPESTAAVVESIFGGDGAETPPAKGKAAGPAKDSVFDD